MNELHFPQQLALSVAALFGGLLLWRASSAIPAASDGGDGSAIALARGLEYDVALSRRLDELGEGLSQLATVVDAELDSAREQRSKNASELEVLRRQVSQLEQRERERAGGTTPEKASAAHVLPTETPAVWRRAADEGS